jgi:hypothetical protein
MGYSNINATPNYQLQGFGQSGMRTISTSQAYVEGEYYRVLVATQDSTISATSVIGDDITGLQVYAGTTIYGLFTAVSVSVGEVTAYLAGATDIDSVWSYINTYGLNNGATIEAADCAKDAIEPLLDKYYAQASLVLVPSLYKTSIVYAERPLNTNGQLTFTRASEATRVGPDGYVEKVRTNLCLQSNTFNTTWTTTSASVTSGQAGYDGTNNAWLLTKSGASGRINQSFSLGAQNTFSVYAKANASSYIAIEFGASFIYVNLTNGEQGSIGAGSYKIESIGSGWYRIIMTSAITSAVFRIYPAENNDLSATTGSIFIQNAQVEAGDIATNYIPTTTAAVSVGPVSNLPRLNYPINADGSVGCPSLLLEPQRSNLCRFSESFDNSDWTKAGSTITANNATSPDGYTNADRLVETATTATHLVSQSVSLTAAAHTFSCFIKAVTGSTRNVGLLFNLTGKGVIVNPSTGAVVQYFGTTTASDVKIETYPNGWYRVSVTATTAAVTENMRIYLADGTTWTAPYAGDGTSSALIWGAQLEAGAYATSYIPTLATSVTRVADACSKTGISSLIGQTEGTLFVDFFYVGNTQAEIIDLSDGTESNRIMFYVNSSSQGQVYVTNGGTSGALITASGFTATPNTEYKIAIGYKENDVVVYINGTQRGTDTSVTIPATSKLTISNGGAGNYPMASRVAQALVFKTRLTNAQLSELTSL